VRAALPPRTGAVPLRLSFDALAEAAGFGLVAATVMSATTFAGWRGMHLVPAMVIAAVVTAVVPQLGG
jgi:predicted branched-subunit amino acid permease